MMEQRGNSRADGHEWIESIRLLLFRVMGARMGVDVEQTSGMLDPRAESVSNVTVVSFHENTFRHAGNPQYVAPMVLLVKGKESKYGLLIDEPDDIVNVRTESIRPLPALVDLSLKSRAVWGVALVDDDMVLLLDLYHLLAPASLEHEARRSKIMT